MPLILTNKLTLNFQIYERHYRNLHRAIHQNDMRVESDPILQWPHVLASYHQAVGVTSATQPNRDTKMRRPILILTAFALPLLLGACGHSQGDRAISGAGIGAVGGWMVGAPLAGAVVGGAAGALTSHRQLDLGRPIWR